MQIEISVDQLDAAVARLDRLPAKAQEAAWDAANDIAGINSLKIKIGAARAGRQARAASASVHATGTAIVGGGPFFMGSVFGGQGRPNTQQFRPYKAESYWFFATLRDEVAETFGRFEQVLATIEHEWVR